MEPPIIQESSSILESSTKIDSPVQEPQIPPQPTLQETVKQGLTDVAVLDNITVTTLSGHAILLRDLWKTERILLVAFRRFGCLICRETAVLLSSHKMKLDELGVRLVGIGFEPVSEVRDFMLYWNGELYFDTPRTVYKALGLKRWTAKELFLASLEKRTYEAIMRNKELHGNVMRGDPMQMGGTFLIGPSPQGILYEHRQTFFGDLPDTNEILRLCDKPKFVFGVYNFNTNW
jgi:peroxiredoxin